MEIILSRYTLTEIWIYPVKSLAGIQLKEAVAQEKGLEFDRRWMIVDDKNRFLTQRELPEMALIQPKISVENGELKSLSLYHKLKRIAPLELLNPCVSDQKKEIEVTIWDDKVQASEISDEANNWLTNLLGVKCKLVYMGDDIIRKIDVEYAIIGDEINSFSDAYPYLIAGNSALALLNSKLTQPINMLRFRPNLVFSGGQAHDEDHWKRLKIGDVIFEGVKNCARCPIPTIDTETALKTKEPLKTLAIYRTKNNKVYFGQNLLIEKIGKLKIGDVIEVL
jgi:uncharacterized protein